LLSAAKFNPNQDTYIHTYDTYILAIGIIFRLILFSQPKFETISIFLHSLHFQKVKNIKKKKKKKKERKKIHTETETKAALRMLERTAK